MKKLLALFLCIVMICSCIPTSVFAEGEDTAIIDSETVEESQEPTESIEEPVADISAVEEPTVEAAPRKAETPALTEEEVIALAEQSWDISKAQDGSITMYLISNGDGTVSAYIYGTGKMFDYDVTKNYSPLYSNSTLKTVRIEKGITNIGNFTFYNCTNLSNVTLPDSVTSIGKSAFNGCGSLESIQIPEGVTSIANQAFYNCVALTNITIPDSVSSIGTQAFCNTGLTSISIGKGIKSITTGAFYGCTCLTNIKIPDGVTSIASSAFYSCTSLTNIEIPNSVTSLGVSAFRNCTSLTSIELPNSIKSIGNYVFDGCIGLTDITIPDSVTSIGSRILRNCTNLTKIVVDENNPSYSSDEYGALFNKDKTILISCPMGYSGSYTIPDGVTSISEYAFLDCSEITSIVIPDSVSSVGEYAFSNCTGLTDITIPDSVVTFPTSAFDGCTNLSNVNVGENNPTYSQDEYGVLFNKNKTALIRCPHDLAGAYVIPDSVISISDYAFSGCGELSSITIPEGIKTIPNYAFENCTKLKSVSIPNSVKTISTAAFFNCNSLKDITIPNNVTSIGTGAFYCCYSLSDITIPDSVTSIGRIAFERCTSLTNVSISDKVSNIRDSAFSGCTNLMSITVNENNPYYSSDEYGILFNKDKTTLICVPGKYSGAYVIPDSVTNISDYAFLDCASVTSVTFPNTIERIGFRAFLNSGLSGEVTIPPTCNVETGAFSECINLEKVTWKQESYPVSNAFIHEGGMHVYQGNEPWCMSSAVGTGINLISHLNNDADFYNSDTIDILGDQSHLYNVYNNYFDAKNIHYTQINSGDLEAMLQALADGKILFIGNAYAALDVSHMYTVFGVSEEGYFYVSDPATDKMSLTKYDPALLLSDEYHPSSLIWAIDNEYDIDIKTENVEKNNESSTEGLPPAENLVNNSLLTKESEWTVYNKGEAKTDISFTYCSEPTDYIYVLDYSESMTRSTVSTEYTNMSVEKTYAFESIANVLNSNSKARVSVVDFRGENEATCTAFTNNPAELYDVIANAECQGVTCYADGFEAALNVMNSRTEENANNKTVVVFVSDGNEQWWINENDASYMAYKECSPHSTTGNTDYGAEEAAALRDAGAEIYAVVLNPDISEAAEVKMTEITADESKVFVAGTIEELGEAFCGVIDAATLRSFTITDNIGEDFNYNGNLTAADGTTAVIDETNRTITWTLDNILPNTEYTLSFDIQSKKDSSGQFVCGDLPTNLGNAVVKEGDIVVNEVETPVLHRDPVLVDDGAQAHMIHKYTDLKRVDNPALYTDGIRFVMDLNMKELQDTYEPGDKLAFGIAMLPLDKLQNGQTTNYLTMNVGTVGQLTCNGSYTFVNNTSAISSSKKLAPANMITWTEAMENCTTPAAFAKLLKAAGMNIFDVTDTGIQYSVYMMFSNASTRQAQADREIAYRGIMVSYDAQNGYAVKYSFQRNNSATRIYNHYNCINYNVINVKGATAADMLHGESEYNPSYEAQAAAQ